MSDPIITVITPIAPHHEALYARRVADGLIFNQSIPAVWLSEVDHDRRGTGWMRNRMLEHTTTPFVVFLDADDWLEPTYLEKTLYAFAESSDQYIYTDWFVDGQPHAAPDRAWCDGRWHTVTALLPTRWVKDVGGFDEKLPGMEDADMFYSLIARYGFGRRLAEPLMHYGAGGQRSAAFRLRDDYNEIKNLIAVRHYEIMDRCCGGQASPIPVSPDPSWVLVRALWGGNRRYRGRQTGHDYGSLGNGKMTHLHPDDFAADRNGFQPVHKDEPSGIADMATQAMAAMRTPQRIVGGSVAPSLNPVQFVNGDKPLSERLTRLEEWFRS